MEGLVGIIQRTRFLPIVGVLACTGSQGQDSVSTDDTSQYDSGDADTDTDTDSDTDSGTSLTYNAPEITSSLSATAYINQEFTYTLTATQDATGTGGSLSCTFNAPFDFQQNGCTMTYTPSSFDLDMGSYNVDVEVSDENGENEGTLELTISEGSGDLITLGTFSDLSGYTNETLSASGSYSGDAASANITLDSVLDTVVSSATASLSGSNVNYNVTFNNDIDWSDFSTGYVSGTATVEVCDGSDYCVSQNLSVSGYAASTLTTNVTEIPGGSALSGATVEGSCDNGDSFEGTTDASGDVYAYLNSDYTTCTISASNGSTHYIHERDDYEISDRTVAVDVQLLQNIDVATEWGSDYADVGDAKTICGWANGIYTTNGGGRWGSYTFIRTEEGALSDTVKVYIATTYHGETDDVSSTSTWTTMEATVEDAIDELNATNPLGRDIYERTTTESDAHAVIYLDDSATSTAPSYDSTTYIMGTVGTGNYSTILLEDGTAARYTHTVMQELNNLFVRDMYDGLGDGGSSYSAAEELVLEVILNSNEQNILEYQTAP